MLTTPAFLQAALDTPGRPAAIRVPDDPDSLRLLDAVAPLVRHDGAEHSCDTSDVWEVQRDASGRYSLHRGQSAPGYADSAVGLLGPLLHRLNMHVAATCHGVVLHAAAVAVGDSAALLVGPSGAGKSTLTAGLVREGADYLGDEAIGVDRDGDLRSYAKPLSLKPGSRHLFPEFAPIAHSDGRAWHVPIQCWRPDAIRVRARLRAVILPRYVAAAPTELTELSVGETLIGLADDTFRLWDDSTAKLELLAESIGPADRVRLVSGRLDDAVAAVLELLRSEEPSRTTSLRAAA